MISTKQVENTRASVHRFVRWLDGYGETSYDHQSFFASDLGRRAKALYYTNPSLGTLAVAPMILCEAFLPSARRLFWKPQRFPIADAHYAMGFAFLSQALGDERYYRRAVHFLEVLKETRSKGYANYCWGYPFNWETRHGTFRAGTPFITSVPYMYEAFRQVYEIDGNPEWREIMESVARHAADDYRDFTSSKNASTCSYTPDKEPGVINASAYRAFLLTKAALDFSEERYRKIAERNLNFVLENQNPDGSWHYSTGGERDFVDHFHTCFVLKALAKIEAITGNQHCTAAIERGVDYYATNLVDDQHLPKPFSRRPRMTVYRRELYDYAECINLALLLQGRFPALDEILTQAINLEAWQKPDGSFRARRLLIGWDNTPMHRWAQAQMFRSLSYLLYQATKKSD
ncbi:MAG TPA: prenyltransferase/squalene oxidase repeat-containing protein [Chthoniobacterales bacterium]